ncbi:TadG family pilus assembly protein [Methylorubrum populi]|uniref:DUF2134 domain-containing protein n=1 Tax=Methylorubrum populi TaxID=223967 RepID=A0A833J3Y2_9HYPH|nr:TadG family pilus assembly protein [Methylorubrum populi]KAB7784145.1 hypothetical protein F8B43_2178 [Methylorubrum populi]
MRFRSDQRGAVSIVTALGLTTLLGAAAFGLDLSRLYGTQRRVQGAADLAALSAASDLSTADAAARRALADNGFGDGTRIGVQAGTYLRSAAVANGSRFTPGATAPNAVRVSLTAPVPLTFGRYLGLPAHYDVSAVGTAANTRFAAFSVGSGVAALDAGLANAVLGALLGTSLSLNLMDYEALLSTRIDVFRFLDALALDLGLQAVSYNDIVTAGVTPAQVMRALAAPTVPAAAGAALGRLGQALPRGANRLPLRDLVDLGDAAVLSPERGSQGPAIRLFDLVAGTAALANGERPVAIDLAATVPGLLATRLTLAIGERRQASGWVAPGSARATLRTGQVRLLIETQVKAPLNLGTLSLPLYVEAGIGQATLRAVSCSGAAGGRQIDLDVQPGLATLAIGAIQSAGINARSPPANLAEPADLLRLPLLSLTVRARAQTTVGSNHARRISFSGDDIARHRERVVSSAGLLGSATGSLLETLTIDIDGSGGLLLPTLRPLLVTTLSAAAPALDAILDGTLRTLGLQVGTATVAAEDIHCEQAVLVQ